MEDYKSKLKNLCEIFLKEENDYSELTKAINDLNQLFCEVSKLEAETEEARENIYLPTGKAIGTFWAAMCVKEIMRTKNFLRGIHKAIKTAQKRFPETPIHILYAGTGPFAALAIPLTALFSPQEIKFTFLEINPESVRLLHNVIAALKLEEYINQIVICDAAEYKHDKNKPVHIIISETMQNALQKEPQVAITLNLLPLLPEKGILIPQNIKIEAALLDPKRNADRMIGTDDYDGKCFHTLDMIFELNKDSGYCNGSSFPEVQVDISQDLDAGYRELCLLTTIQVFEDVYLTHWQCSLNMPKKIMRLDQESTPVKKVSFQYEMSRNPGFILKILP